MTDTDRARPPRLTAVDRVQELLANRVTLLERLSCAYALAQHAQATGRFVGVPAGHRKWDDKFAGALEDEDGEGEWDEAGED